MTKLKSLPNFPKPKEGIKFHSGRQNSELSAFSPTDNQKVGYNACLSEVGELDVPVPSVEELTNIISNYCSRPGFDEYTRCAEYIHNLITKRSN